MQKQFFDEIHAGEAQEFSIWVNEKDKSEVKAFSITPQGEVSIDRLVSATLTALRTLLSESIAKLAADMVLGDNAVRSEAATNLEKATGDINVKMNELRSKIEIEQVAIKAEIHLIRKKIGL